MGMVNLYCINHPVMTFILILCIVSSIVAIFNNVLLTINNALIVKNNELEIKKEGIKLENKTLEYYKELDKRPII